VLDVATGFMNTEPQPKSGGGGPLGITLDPNGSNMWFTQGSYNGYVGDQVASVVPSNGTITEYSLNIASANPDQIVYDPADGNLWFTEVSANKIGRINPTNKAVAEFAVPTAGARPTMITVDP
jgi:virginiamycin B lyase